MGATLEESLAAVVEDVLHGPLDDHQAAIIRTAAELLALLTNRDLIDKDEFRRLRRQTGHSQGQLGELLHVHRFTVSRWETGQTPVPLYIVPILEVLQSC